MANALPRAFFSYSRHDSEFVLKLARDLREGGAHVWLDQLDIEPGYRWDSAVEQALASCPTMLLVLSPSSVASNNVMDEVSFALEEKRRIIPVLYQDCKIPFRLRRLQYVDVRTDYPGKLRELLRMLEASPAQPAPLNAPAAPALPVAAQPAIAPSTREREQAAAAEAHEQAEHEGIERVSTASLAGRRENTAADVAEPPEAQRPVAAGTTAVEPVSSRSRRKLIMSVGGAAAAALLIGAMWLGTSSKQGENVLVQAAEVPEAPKVIETAKLPYPEKQTQPAPTAREPQRETKLPQPDLEAKWLSQFLEASQGPSTETLRPFFHDTVAPYFGLPSTDWSGIEKDKKRYFSRFPQIRIRVTDKPQVTKTDQGEVVDVTVEYENTRNDGYVARGTSQMTITVRSIDGAWKIVGIRERVKAA